MPYTDYSSVQAIADENGTIVTRYRVSSERRRGSTRVPAYDSYLGVTTEYIFYCKRAILFLSSSKILTPHPPRGRREKQDCPLTVKYVLCGCNNLALTFIFPGNEFLSHCWSYSVLTWPKFAVHPKKTK